VHDALAVKICNTRGQLGRPKANYVLRKISPGIEVIYNDLVGIPQEGMKMKLTPKIATKHEIEDEETVIIVLESVAKVDQEGVIDLHRGSTNKKTCNKRVPHLLEQSSFLDDVGNSLLFDALLLVYVLERIQFLGPFMFNDANLGTCMRNRARGTTTTTTTNLSEGTFTDHSVEVEVIK
jgi:hypothetical protein